jgi:perosamine synthetase
MTHLIPLSHPEITRQDIDSVVTALQSGKLSNGQQMLRFEEVASDLTSRTHGIAVSSGTAALHLVLLGLGIRPGDEVITTSFSFVASANAILMAGARPVFVDIDPQSLNLDPDLVQRAVTPRTKAILAVEVFGNPTHMDRLAQIAGANDIPLIEDACEALGGRYKGRAVGSFGRAAVFGFYSNKTVTTGEGGLIVTDDDKLADFCRKARNQGRPYALGPDTPLAPGGQLQHDCMGYNYRLSEMACALGVSQMARLSKTLETRRTLALRYMTRLMEVPEITLPNVPEPDNFSWFLFVVRLSNRFSPVNRDRIISGMRRHEIGCSNYFPCIHLLPHYQSLGHHTGECPVAESVSGRTLALPLFNQLEPEQVDLIASTLRVMIDREKLSLSDEE